MANVNQNICLPIQRRGKADDINQMSPKFLVSNCDTSMAPCHSAKQGYYRIPHCKGHSPVEQFFLPVTSLSLTLQLPRLLTPPTSSHLVRKITSAVHLFEGRKEDMVRS